MEPSQQRFMKGFSDHYKILNILSIFTQSVEGNQETLEMAQKTEVKMALKPLQTLGKVTLWQMLLWKVKWSGR